jgi:asparagine synthase (glutamine-hydrolysing)
VTLIAGCFCLDRSEQVPPEFKAALSANLRRVEDSRGEVYCFDRNGFFLTKWDSGAFREPAWIESIDGSVATLVGDPLLTGEEGHLHRSVQLEHLHLFGPEVGDRLVAARGSFGIVCFSKEKNTLKIATDAIGLRTFYYTVQKGMFLFASALRILEAIPGLELAASILGVAEQCLYTQPLGSRSLYEGVSILREAESITVTRSGIQASRYYDWAIAEWSPPSEEVAAEWLYRHFADSVRVRALTGERTNAFLSGGMDSRAIVSTLIACGHSVVALNFSPAGSQDHDFAAQFAKAAGEKCSLFCFGRGDNPNFSLLAYGAKASLARTEQVNVTRPEVIWAGDGGSVGLGHVYMDEGMLDLCDKGDVEAAVRYFMALHGNYLPVGVMAAAWRQQLPELIFRDVVSEVMRYPRADVGRQLYLFLLMNDQRRHLSKHFESIDEHGLEFLTPFFDSVFLRAVAATPVRWGVLHRLYALWFDQLPPFARTTPWQTYPGHVPCPIAVDEGLTYQWATESAANPSSAKERLKIASELASEAYAELPDGLFSRGRILLCAALHAMGLRDGRYALHITRAFHQVWARTN